MSELVSAKKTQAMYCKECGLTWTDSDGCCVHCGVEAIVTDTATLLWEDWEKLQEDWKRLNA